MLQSFNFYLISGKPICHFSGSFGRNLLFAFISKVGLCRFFFELLFCAKRLSYIDILGLYLLRDV